MRLGSRNGAVTGDWSKTGGAGEPQPDNREFKVRYKFLVFFSSKLSIFIIFVQVEGEHDEACIAMLNNFYADGAVSFHQFNRQL